MANKTEEKMYLVPDLELRISESWINLIAYCQEKFPYGDITIRIASAQPTELLDEKPKVRFDKRYTIPGTVFGA